VCGGSMVAKLRPAKMIIKEIMKGGVFSHYQTEFYSVYGNKLKPIKSGDIEKVKELVGDYFS
jgi:hypothetical protein